MGGIDPPLTPYQDAVLPLNYTGNDGSKTPPTNGDALDHLSDLPHRFDGTFYAAQVEKDIRRFFERLRIRFAPDELQKEKPRFLSVAGFFEGLPI